MRKAFIDFLVEEGTLPAAQVENLRSLLRGAPEPIGSIAFSYGMLTGADIDQILDRQKQQYQPFGEIAVDLGFITKAQVEALLKVQEMRAATETAEALALSGVCPAEHVMAQLGQFLIGRSVTMKAQAA